MTRKMASVEAHVLGLNQLRESAAYEEEKASHKNENKCIIH